MSTTEAVTGALAGDTTQAQSIYAGTFTLLASDQTVQVLSPTVVNDVLYCTIQTIPSGVIASYPIPVEWLGLESSSDRLGTFAHNIEEAMALPYVVAGAGTQTLDANGLLQDMVSFTVQYVQPDTTGTQVTAEAIIPVAYLIGPSILSATPGNPTAKSLLDAVYADLQLLAGG